MPLTLEDILAGRVPEREEASPGLIPSLAETGAEPEGMKRMGKLAIAGAVKLLEIAIPIFGSDSEEGKKISRAIKTLSPLTKGIKDIDLSAILTMVPGHTPPPGMPPTPPAPEATPGTLGFGTLAGTPTLEELLRPGRLEEIPEETEETRRRR
ncbi:MAG: hypothetical protein QXJ20_02740 [Candidatus Aenigmatarchaeota archaeon]